MRDALLLLFIIGSLAAALRYPFVGVLLWAWFTLMTPHQMAYGVFGISLNVLIAGATIVSVALTGAWRHFRLDATIVLLVLFAFWLFVAQLNSLRPENSYQYFDRFLKTLIFVFFALQLATSKLKFHALVWMFVACLGYFGLKGGLFTLVTLGHYRVQGLTDTVLGDNNHLGIALATSLPMYLYLHSQATSRYARLGLIAVFVLTVVAIIGTQSRGAFVSLVVFAFYFWLRSRRKLMILGALAALMGPAIAFMPSKWTERMSTISEAENDDSFMGRVDAWVINTKLALAHPFTGVGLRNSYEKDIAATVEPNRTPRAAHSIYFEVLGGSGFVGLAIYLSLLGNAVLTTFAMQRRRDLAAASEWTRNFCYYAQISLAVFCVGGATVSLEMWDGYMLIIALIAAAQRLAGAEGAATMTAAGRRVSWRSGARGLVQARNRPAREPSVR
ncbi:MAG: putative O-glycosylation ligase, exosortase A system-associated [Parvularculaceae bacterium]|nr:putative O-glycosylation ligase, exosortase A system-associated [Parvularculaceae bacterium]